MADLREYQHTVEDVLGKTTGRWWWVVYDSAMTASVLLRDAGWVQGQNGSTWWRDHAQVRILRITGDHQRGIIGYNADGWCGIEPEARMGHEMLCRMVGRATPVGA